VRLALHDLAEAGYLERDPPLNAGAVRGKPHVWSRTDKKLESGVPTTRKGPWELKLSGARSEPTAEDDKQGDSDHVTS
jgi:hypothetical protein